MTDKKTRELLSQIYWRAFYDGCLAWKKCDIDFGSANISIESTALQMECKPVRMKKAEPVTKRLLRKLKK